MRITAHPVLGPQPTGRPIRFCFNGEVLQGHDGEPIAMALAALGRLQLRKAHVSGQPRGLYCGMGHCYECQVSVDGVPGLRACLTPLRDGMQVEG